MARRIEQIKLKFIFHLKFFIYSLIFRRFINVSIKVQNFESYIIPTILTLLFFSVTWLVNTLKNISNTIIIGSVSFFIFLFHIFILSQIVYNNIPIEYRYNEVHFIYIFTASVLHLPILKLVHYFFKDKYVFIIAMFLYSILVSTNLYRTIKEDGISRFTDYVVLFAVISILYHFAMCSLYICVADNLVSMNLFTF